MGLSKLSVEKMAALYEKGLRKSEQVDERPAITQIKPIVFHRNASVYVWPMPGENHEEAE